MPKAAQKTMWTKSQEITSRIKAAGGRFHASDNIASFMEPGDKQALIHEVEHAFQKVLDALVIDSVNDHNSKDTAKRLAKMYINELMAGRYEPRPKATAFPNEGPERFEGMLVIPAELTSMCSHHHQPVKGVAYIGLIPTGEVIGLSKYVRIAQWLARRGQLQENLCNQIAKEIMSATDTENVAVYLQMTHGCMEHRGVGAHNSATSTAVVHGLFHNDSVKKEFFDHVRMKTQPKTSM